MTLCPYCNKKDVDWIACEGKITYEGKKYPDVKKMLSYAQDGDLFYCKQCQTFFTYDDYPPVDERILFMDFTMKRYEYRPDTLKYIIINNAPPTMYKGEEANFFYSNADFIQDFLYSEIMTTLFLPKEYIEKARTIDLTVDIEMHREKYLKMFQEKGFWQWDALPYSKNMVDSNDKISNAKKVLNEMMSYAPNILAILSEFIKPDTIFFFVQKNVYDLYYPILSQRYKIANDGLNSKYNTPYLPAPHGHQREFRKKFKECLDFVNYQF